MKLLFLSCVSACLEIGDPTPYYAAQPYHVFLNGRRVYTDKKENVFSLFDLSPATAYTVQAGDKSLCFTTPGIRARLNVRELGAAGDGVKDDTAALQRAVDACPPGGLVEIPAGEYRLVSLSLKSHLTLHLCAGARLKGDPDPARYPVLPATRPVDGREVPVSVWEGTLMPSYAHTLMGYGLEQVQVVGRGTVDSNAQNGPWWQDRYQTDLACARPRAVFFNACRQLGFHGITVENSAAWSVHPFFCEDIGFFDMNVNAPKRSPNTDGINPEGCDGVQIVGCRISTGDDCIAIKSGKRELARAFGRRARNHVIRNCRMADGHGAVVLGSEIAGGVEGLTVTQCLFEGTDRGLRIKTCRGRGKESVVDGVEFSHIRMNGVLTPFVINMFYNCGVGEDKGSIANREPLPVDENTPRLGRFVFRDMQCTDCQVCAGWFDGLPEQPIQAVRMENVRIGVKEGDKAFARPAAADAAPKMTGEGLIFQNVESVELCNVEVLGARERLTARACPRLVDTKGKSDEN